jgi:hypothetical protein
MCRMCRSSPVCIGVGACNTRRGQSGPFMFVDLFFLAGTPSNIVPCSDCKTAYPVQVARIHFEHLRSICALAFSPDGKWLLVVSPPSQSSVGRWTYALAAFSVRTCCDCAPSILGRTGLRRQHAHTNSLGLEALEEAVPISNQARRTRAGRSQCAKPRCSRSLAACDRNGVIGIQ